MKKQTTIHDIAKMANVSSATVSRVLSNSGYPVSKELKERIQRIAKEANYIPNMLGKQLKKNTSQTIGVIIPSIINPFYSSVIFGVEEIARQNGFTVIVCNSLQDPSLEEEYIRTIMEKQVKGLIISSISTNKEHLKQLIQMGLNVIAIDQKIEEDNINQIEFDYHKAGCLATRYLLEHGHRLIGYVTSKLDRPSRRSIYEGYAAAMKDAGLKPLVVESQTDEVYNAITDFDTGKQLTKKLLNQSPRPTAIFACNDMMAFGVINELSRCDIQVPQQMSVMGFDGIDVGEMIHPPLTTIKQPDYEMGKMACKMLLDMMNGEDSPMFDITLQPKLLERKSVMDIRSEQ
ncbi:LacI family DNA-binding transcriptional regulator [Paenibacillus senegalensis]|uniref:LacI family DNA-binding transcriptional regulator n=1 Tax=Paenibacillus senegalensis TaxID=1465766 RepID=UPI0002890435|nr:LacI family DNA-binding transcriptional regulator [Paenibacillus senegalensis]